MTIEQLLNRLIQRGWKPFGSYKDIITRYKYDNRFFEFNHEGDNMVSIRELVSKESGLWQFVCENGMVENGGYVNGWCYHNDYDEYDEGDGNNYDKELKRFYDTNYEYRLIEASLKDESELEDFLLQNIKIEGNEK